MHHLASRTELVKANVNKANMHLACSKSYLSVRGIINCYCLSTQRSSWSRRVTEWLVEAAPGSTWPCLSRLDKMTSRGPFQTQPSCESVRAHFSLAVKCFKSQSQLQIVVYSFALSMLYIC